MPKDTFYFSHDYNARNDRRLSSLRMKHGIEAIGVYWCVVEMLYEEDGYLMQSDCERIAFELRADAKIVESVIKSSLFHSDEERFWSESVLRRIKLRKDKSDKNRESALERWRNERNANALQMQSERYAIKGKDIKLKERIFGFAFDEEKENVIFPDQTKQILGKHQKVRAINDDIKPEEIFKGEIY